MYQFVNINDDFSSKSNLKLIKPKDLIFLNLYFVSDNKKLTKLTPRIPDNGLTEDKWENDNIKRVCFAPSIDKCLLAITPQKGSELYVYVPKGSLAKHKISKINTKDVPDVMQTDEYWCLDDIEVQLLYKIKVGNFVLSNSSKHIGNISYKILDVYDVNIPNILEEIANLEKFKFKSIDENDISSWIEFSDYKIARKFETTCKKYLTENLLDRYDNKVYYLKLRYQ